MTLAASRKAREDHGGSGRDPGINTLDRPQPSPNLINYFHSKESSRIPDLDL